METIENDEPLSTPMVPASNGGYMALIEKLAATPTRETVEVIERMLAVQERWEATQAEKAFNEAMERLQEALPPIIKNTKGSKAMYAKLEDIDLICRPYLKQERFSISYDTDHVDGGCLTIGTLRHSQGHKITSKIWMPLDGFGNKAMNALQGMNSSNSYGKNRVFCNLLNIVPVGEDDQGEAGGKVFINVQQVKIVNDLIVETGTILDRFLHVMNVDSVESLTTQTYPVAINILSSKKKVVQNG